MSNRMVKQASVFQSGWVATAEGERPPLNEERLSPEEAAKVGAYLENGAVVMHTTARGVDVLADDARVVPLTIRTDGEYVWTGPVTYYVQTYGVAPDPEFLAHVRAQGYEARTPTDDEIAAAAKVFAPPA
ncbi:hypothetical protein [Microbacterium aurum]